MIKKYKKAFSLIEISVVILIIGVLISGISQGIDLYNDYKIANARTLTLNSIVPRIQNLSMWYETTSENSFKNAKPNDGELINQWNDINPQRTMKINLFNIPNDASRPAYKNSAINGLPALKFSNAQNLRSNDIRGVDFFETNGITVFLIQNATGKFGGFDSPISWVPTSDNSDTGSEIERFCLTLPFNNVDFLFDSGSGGTASRIKSSIASDYNNKNNLFSFKRLGSQMSMRLNGQQIAYSSTIASSFFNNYSAPFIVGKLRTSNSYGVDGLIGEIIVYGSGLNINEIQKIEAYLAKKWGIKI
jgi:prepilin-type N-terminal cleavage/methylation domain-containing protein